MELLIDDIYDTCHKAFIVNGVANSIANEIVNELIQNNLDGYPSHGVIRVLEYINYIKTKDILPENKPYSEQISNFVFNINGNNSFGLLVKNEIQEKLSILLSNNKFGFITFANSSHLGRLSNLVRPLVIKGGIVLGFVNFSGAGQNVIPFNGKYGKLCTNPMVMGAPSSNDPIIIDFSTSSYSEGKIRNAYLNEEKIPEDILVDSDGNTIIDPKEFYERYGEIFITPLGGKNIGHKGFGLGLFTEILAGILSNGGDSSKPSKTKSNSGFFIIFSPEIFNQELTVFEKDVSRLIKYIKGDEERESNNMVKIPGINKNKDTLTNKIYLPVNLWKKLQLLVD